MTTDYANWREIVQSPIEIGSDEARVYTLNLTPWGGSSSAPANALFYQGGDVSASHLSGTATISGTAFTSQVIHSIEAGLRYHWRWTWFDGSGTVSAYVEVIGRL